MDDSDWTKLIKQLIEKGYKGDFTIEGYHDPIYSGEREMDGQLLALDYLKNVGVSLVINFRTEQIRKYKNKFDYFFQ